VKKLDVNNYSFAHLTLILLLHYLVKCRSRSLAIYNNEFILVAHASAQKVIGRPQNHWKNDRLYVPTATKKRDISATRLLQPRSNFSKSMMVSVAVSSLSASNIYVLEPRVKINGAYYRDVVLRDAASWHSCNIWKRVFRFSAGQCPITSRQRHSSAACWIKRRPMLSHPLSGRLTHQTSTQLTTLCRVCFRNESIVPRSRTSTNWNDASTVSGALWVTRLLNVLLASGVNIYALAFVLEADILSTCCNKHDVM